MSLTVTALRPARSLPDPGSRQPATETAATPTGSRALVAVGPTPPRPAVAAARTSLRPDAAYLAQLIATAAQAPQTRARCRAEPAAAAEIYRASLVRVAPAAVAMTPARLS